MLAVERSADGERLDWASLVLPSVMVRHALASLATSRLPPLKARRPRAFARARSPHCVATSPASALR